jgi:cysteine sulfinate desulfinase/cysteine desulfurase-like protein
MVCALEAGFGNASRLHTVGQEARRLVERARAQAAKLTDTPSGPG